MRTTSLLLAGAFALSTPRAQPPNNVLILVADDLGVENVGAYGVGAAPAPTPHLDALAARGVLFRTAWANPVCSPTRACFQTGRYSLRTYVGTALPLVGSRSLRASETTLPEVLDLGGSGYAHAAIGKWHLSDPGDETGPNDAGWSHFAGLIPGTLDDYYAWPRTENGTTATSTAYATTQMVDDAVAWIGQQTGPWVCYVAFYAPHMPFHAPPPHLHTQDLTGKNPGTEPVPFYKAAIEAMDAEIGRLIGAVDPALQTTNVIFVADNGTPDLVAEPPLLPSHAKGTPYEGALHVPLIVAGPIVQSPGREETALVTAVDLFATAAELAGCDPAAVIPPWIAVDAVSMVPYLTSSGQAPRRSYALAEAFAGSNFLLVNGSGFVAIRSDRFKLIRAASGEEMYDLAVDPLETNDLLKTQLSAGERQAHDDLVAELVRLRVPAGSIHHFGTTNCLGTGGALTLLGSGAPAIGQAYQIALAGGAPSTIAVLMVGLSSTAWGALSLPLALEPTGGGPDCFLWTSCELALPAALNATGDAAVDIAVPPLLELVGETVFHSWLNLDFTAPNNLAGVTTSNAAAVVVGV